MVHFFQDLLALFSTYFLRYPVDRTQCLWTYFWNLFRNQHLISAFQHGFFQSSLSSLFSFASSISIFGVEAVTLLIFFSWIADLFSFLSIPRCHIIFHEASTCFIDLSFWHQLSQNYFHDKFLSDCWNHLAFLHTNPRKCYTFHLNPPSLFSQLLRIKYLFLYWVPWFRTVLFPFPCNILHPHMPQSIDFI